MNLDYDAAVQCGRSKGGKAGGAKAGSRSAGGNMGVDGGWHKTPEGDIQPNGKLGPVKNQEEFDQKVGELVQQWTDRFDMLGVPISMIRRASGMDRTTFDNHFKSFFRNEPNGFQVRGAGIYAANDHLGEGKLPAATSIIKYNHPDNIRITNARINDSFTTPTGALRTFVFAPNKTNPNH